MNRTLTAKAKCFLFDADLPKSYWAEAISMAAYIVNRSPCTRLSDRILRTPEEVFTEKRCDLSDLKLFGSKVMVLRPKQTRSKWDKNSTKMVFVGYDDRVKGYRCVNTSNRKVIVSRNVKFLETESNKNKVHYSMDSSEEENTEQIDESDTESEDLNETIVDSASAVSENNDEMNEITEMESDKVNDLHEIKPAKITVRRASSRNRTPFQPFQMGHFAFIVELCSEIEPNNVTEAKKSVNSEKWLIAMDDKIEAHKINGTWMLTDLPSGRKAITAKWVFKVKAVDTINERFKARVVARGYAQVPGIDYDETFSPVVRHTSLRILFALAIRGEMNIFQMDAITPPKRIK